MKLNRNLILRENLQAIRKMKFSEENGPLNSVATLGATDSSPIPPRWSRDVLTKGLSGEAELTHS
jgi:hypothetical protein